MDARGNGRTEFAMIHAESIPIAGLMFGLGLVFLFLAGLQVWAGRAFLGFGWPWHRTLWFYREKEPADFWFRVGSMGALGVFCIGLAAVKLM